MNVYTVYIFGDFIIILLFYDVNPTLVTSVIVFSNSTFYKNNFILDISIYWCLFFILFFRSNTEILPWRGIEIYLSPTVSNIA
jgi:hypothetical protein